MLNTRYDIYTNNESNLPFMLYKNLKITPQNFTTSANWHENLEIQFCLDGNGIVLLDGEEYNITKGDIIVANSNVIHHMNTKSEVEYSCIIIDTSFCKQADIDTSELQFNSFFKDEKLFGLFRELNVAYSDTKNICRTAILRKIVLEILIMLRLNHTSSVTANRIKSHSYERVKNAIKIIRQEYNNKLTLEYIAKQVYTDKFTLSKEFKKLTQMTVVEYVNNYRTKKAAELIKDGMTVNEAARKCGFNNMSFFTKTFKSYMGALPSKYKKP